MDTRPAALFDVDRTLLHTDSATLYLRQQRARGEAGFRDTWRLAWWLLEYSLGVVDASAVARRVLGRYAGRGEAELATSFEEWFPRYALPELSSHGREVVRHHLARGDLVALLSGAPRYALAPLARELGIEHVVATEVETDRGRLTGRVLGLCYGPAKVEFAARLLSQHGSSFAAATFYSDSITDLPMFERVARPVVVNPDFRLRRLARQRGWPVERW
jgi:HAD superfamily hydrolase (TIGR01490 family)